MMPPADPDEDWADEWDSEDSNRYQDELERQAEPS